ncbi:DUF2085 domain-containing protein [Nostoc sp.]|uniref:DUF2085 domain-containing protein n=1 Tax=Nostoc sp. TaxID=1180 RepID=UPI003FA597E6
MIKKPLDKILIKLFVDNIFLYKFVRCHRLSSRSFFVNNRQFHVCARCTGLLVGYAISPAFLLIKNYPSTLFILFFLALVLDGTTQLIGLRESNNTLRFVTGIGTGATSLSFLWSIIHHVLKLG